MSTDTAYAAFKVAWLAIIYDKANPPESTMISAWRLWQSAIASGDENLAGKTAKAAARAAKARP